MRKATIAKRFSAVSLAVIMAFTVYMPATTFASEDAEGQSADAPKVEESSSEPAPKETPAPAPKETPAPAPKESSAPAAQESSAPAAQESSAPAAQEADAPSAQSSEAEQSAPDAPVADTQDAPEADVQSAPEADTQDAPAKNTAAVQSDSQTSLQGGLEPDAKEEQSSAPEKSNYGEATGNWGYGNSTHTVRWDEYTIDGETILVFRITGESDIDEENAVTELLDSAGKSLKNELKNRVTQIVFEDGITGIGWTYLYDGSNYQPLYSSDYTVDRTKTDLFNGFSKLTKVTPCDTIKRIGWSAFRKCSNLNDFDFSKCSQLEEIMNQAFSDCKSLNNVNLVNCKALTTLAWSAFNGAGQGVNASIALPVESALSVIGGYAFYGYAKNNAAGAAVDFTTVALSVTQILVKAFEGSHILGTISGFENLDTVGKDAFRNSYITYIPYEPPQEEENNEAPPSDDNNNEAPASDDNSNEAPASDDDNNEAPASDDDNNEAPASDDDSNEVPASDDDNNEAPASDDDNNEAPASDDDNNEAPASDDDNNEAPASDDSSNEQVEVPIAIPVAALANTTMQAVMSATSSTAPAPAAEPTAVTASPANAITPANALTSARASASSAKASAQAAGTTGTAGIPANLTAMTDGASPAAAPENTADLNDTDVPMTNMLTDSSHGYIFYGTAAGLLLALAAIALMIRRRSETE